MMESIGAGEYEYYNRGITLFDHGLYAEAIAEFKLLLSEYRDESPEHKLASFYVCESYMNLGLAHLRMGLYHRAEEDLKSALEIHPEYADLHFYLAVVYYQESRYDEAEGQFLKALAINPKYVKALIYLGLTRLRNGEEEGLGDIAEAVTIEPTYNDEKCQSALDMYREGNADQAIHLLEELAETDVDQISYLLEKGRKLMKEKAFLEASNALLEAVSMCPHYADLRHDLGLCYVNQGMIELAVGQFLKALEINPAFITARLNLALAYEKDGRSDLAISELEYALKLDPSDPIVRKTLSKMTK